MIDVTDSRISRINRRRLCTGETTNMIRRQLRSGSDVLIPEAQPSIQRDFEGRVLAVLLTALGSDLRMIFSGPHVIRVRPTETIVSIELSASAIECMLDWALPLVDHSHGTGLPGLRVVPARSHIELRQIGETGLMDSRVRLLGMNRESWRRIEETLGSGPKSVQEQIFPDKQPAVGGQHKVWRPARNALHHAEHEFLVRHQTTFPRAMSAVLRRLKLWHDAPFVHAIHADDAVRVTWQPGPTAEAIAAVLSGPTCGVPGTCVWPERLYPPLHSVLITENPHASLGDSEPEWAWQQLANLRMNGRMTAAQLVEAHLTPEDDELLKARFQRPDIPIGYGPAHFKWKR